MNSLGLPANWSPILLSAMRIAAALLFFEHGTQKLLGFPAATARPPLMSLLGAAGVLEVVGGGLVLIGLFTRPAAFILSGMMAAAYFIAHAPRSLYPVRNGGDAAILFCFVFLYISAAGPGPLSIDARRAR